MKNSMRICVDASIIVRLAAPRRHSRIKVLWNEWIESGLEPVAPSLLRYEVTNAFNQMKRHDVVSPSLARELLETALRLPITYYDDSFLSRDALILADQQDLRATYDAHYLALSEHLGCEFWTTDRRFFNAIRNDFSHVRFVDES